MKYRFVFLILALLASGSCIRGKNEQEIFLRANLLYEERQYDQARQLYESIEHKGSAAFYNLGNCWYQIGKLSQALLNWRRAERLASYKELDDIWYNINIVKNKLREKKKEDWHEQIYYFTRKLLARISMFQLQLLFLLFFMIVLLLSFRLYRTKHFVFLIFLLLGVAGFGGALAFKYSLQGKVIGIVMKPSVCVYTGPHETYAPVGMLDEALEVEILYRQHEWYKVRHNQMVGWILANKIEQV